MCCRVVRLSDLSACGIPGPEVGVSSVGVFLMEPSLYLREFWRKTTENSKRLGRQVRLGIEPITSTETHQTSTLYSSFYYPTMSWLNSGFGHTGIRTFGG